MIDSTHDAPITLAQRRILAAAWIWPEYSQAQVLRLAPYVHLV